MSALSSLPLFHRVAGQRILVLGDGDAADAKRRLVERSGAVIEIDQARAVDEGVRLAFVAFDDPKACEIAAINLRCAGLLVNVVDRPDLCDFTTPSILERDPVLIAIATAGASAGLAKHLRLRLERLLPPTLGKLASALFNVRATLRRRFPDAAVRRRAIDEALRAGGTLDPLDPSAFERVEAWASTGTGGSLAGPMCITLGSDDPEDLTLRQMRWLGEAEVVCARGPVPEPILTRARADAVRIECDRRTCDGWQPDEVGAPVPPCVARARAITKAALTVICDRKTDIAD
ncbi:MAG: NAD(P)-dependent oxidoreductase [Erythrobacter sp.]